MEKIGEVYPQILPVNRHTHATPVPVSARPENYRGEARVLAAHPYATNVPACDQILGEVDTIGQLLKLPGEAYSYIRYPGFIQ